MVAGAGSGKTTSLIKALKTIIDEHGTSLRKKRQRVACITYTEIASKEIWADISNNPLVHVSTIHSFFWMIIRSFQNDIRDWVAQRIDEKLAELRAAAAGFGPRVHERTRERNKRDIERYEYQRTRIGSVSAFTYGTGSDYIKGVLGHDDVIKIASAFLTERPLFRTLFGQQFPFLFVDESQDTMPYVVDALKAVQHQMRSHFCLGFFGDPMQQIYPTGVGKIQQEAGWITITKPENFRCATSVLSVANAIRRGGDDLVQVGGRTSMVEGEARPVIGTARIFILPIDEQRNERLLAVRDWISRHNNDPEWQPSETTSVKTLVIVHRMAASRLGFSALYSAMNDNAPETFKAGFLDASAWPLRPFVSFVIPLSDAVRKGQEFKAMSILRSSSPRLVGENLRGRDVAQVLGELREACMQLAEMVSPDSNASVRDVLLHLRDSRLLTLDHRIMAYLDDQTPENVEGDDDNDDGDNREITAMDSFMRCEVSQFLGYQAYLNDESPFSTQQGIKGAEFARVLVVLDDDEGTHVQFSYDKYFGIKRMSARDEQNVLEGKETAIERTRRLFYVCCTRARTDLAVVLFSNDIALAERQVRATGIFPDNAVYTLPALAT